MFSQEEDKEARKCKECRKLRVGLTWIGDPPRCPEHTEKKNILWR